MSLRILIAVWPLPTHVFPMLALAEEARSRGHAVQFYSGGDFASFIEAQGYECRRFQHLRAETIQGFASRLLHGGANKLATARVWREFLVETIPEQARDLEAICRELRPDVILTDMSVWAPILVLRERLGLPVALYSHVATSLLPGPEGPSLGAVLRRPHKGLTRTRSLVIRRLIRIATRAILRRVNGIRGTYGLPPLHESVNSFSGKLPLYLMPGTPELDHNRGDLPRSVHYVGCCAWEPREENELREEATSPSWTLAADEGHYHRSDLRFLETVRDAARTLGQTLTITTGRGRSVSVLDQVFPPDQKRARFLSSLGASLAGAEMLITTGNADSVLPALLRGIPLILLPQSVDQTELALAVERSGAGVRLPRKSQSASELQQVIQTLRANSSFRRAAGKLAEQLRAREGPPRAIDLLEQLVALGRQPHATPARADSLLKPA